MASGSGDAAEAADAFVSAGAGFPTGSEIGGAGYETDLVSARDDGSVGCGAGT